MTNNNSNKPVIQINNISKKYEIFSSNKDRLKELINPFKIYHREFWALKDISFDLYKSETVGIIGRNGSGKSTLLQILVGVIKATSGEVNVDGRISALLELGAGFNPEFTGKENAIMNGALMGFDRKSMLERVPLIEEFAEIGDFIDQPVKTYSSGMFIRLAFACAINIEPDILIIDEALAVGDARFQLKCFTKIQEFQKRGKTILFVSHDSNSIKQYCTKAILLENGEKIEEGDPNIVVNNYTKILFPAIKQNVVNKSKDENTLESENELYKMETINEKEFRYGNEKGKILEPKVYKKNGLEWIESTHFDTGDESRIIFTVLAQKEIKKPIVAMTLKTIKGLELYGTNTFFEEMEVQGFKEGNKYRIEFVQNLMLAPGDYFISLGLVEFIKGELIPIDRRYDIIQIKVASNKRTVGIVNLSSKIKISSSEIY